MERTRVDRTGSCTLLFHPPVKTPGMLSKGFTGKEC